jgi:hypothetical protein
MQGLLSAVEAGGQAPQETLLRGVRPRLHDDPHGCPLLFGNVSPAGAPEDARKPRDDERRTAIVWPRKERAAMRYPVYVFDARTSLLAVNVFGRRHDCLKARQRREIEEIIAGLAEDLAAGSIAPNGVKVGWPGVGLPPVDAVDIHGPEMAGWFARAYVVRVVDEDAQRAYVRHERTRDE